MNMYCYDNSKNTTEIEMSADIEYRNDGMFVRFYPVTNEGKKAWEQMIEQSGSAVVLAIESKKIIAQLRSLGFKVKKSESVKESDDDLLLALMS